MLQGSPLETDGNSLRVVFATPDRAFATAAEIWGLDEKRALLLPIVSVEQQEIVKDELRYRNLGVRWRPSNIGYSDENKTEGNSAVFPRAYDLSYQVDFWSKTDAAANAFAQWVAFEFVLQKPAFLSVSFEGVWSGWGRKLIELVSEGVSDTSTLEADEDRTEVRMTWTFTLKGWLLPEMTTTKTVLSIEQETYLGNLDSTATVQDVDDGEFDESSKLTVDEDGWRPSE